MKREPVSVLIPAFNEEAAVDRVVRGVRAVLKRARIPHEILVIDDGSSDRTSERARRSGATVVSMGENHGYGASLKAGLRHSRHGLIAILDADGTYPARELPALHALMGTADMAVGARVKPGASIPFLRRFPKWILSKWAGYLADRRIPDLNSGLRVFKRSVASRYEGLFPNGFSFTTTLTLALECHGYVVKYRPIDYAPRVGESKIFIPLSGIMFLWGGSLGFYEKQHGLPLSGAALLLLVGAVQVAALGLLADLLVKRGR
jgi:glycosyltransferase involved in cell wall biosynthesis